ncbi:hypothetical protein AGRA3207_002482 [Actinomadura graeca]|uniref:Uncharacterized protein n=1 Tax=Actinomadura graeca TaxID=2750812 RepID=A0ABX8QVY3_9ACTN|nr:hypothetical protein [Actinomadura graeca]QXJ21612.1 hypothetical protein AGRA3207_002482 [Actinomadura graeca]
MLQSVPAGPSAPGMFDGVAVTAAGTPRAFTSQAGTGANLGQAWDLASGAPAGPPVPDFPDDRADWAFGLPDGAPVVAWTRRDRIHVHDLRTGGEVTLEPDRSAPPDLVGLSAHRGRGAVVAVFGPAHDAEVVVWDAATGDRLAEFGVWLGHSSAIGRRLLPVAGPLVALIRDTGRADGADGAAGCSVGVLDVERGEEVACPPSLGSGRAAFAECPGGPVLVQPGSTGLVARHLDGTRFAVLPAPLACDQVAAASASGRLLAAAGVSGGTVLVWDAADPGRPRRIRIPAPVNDLALSPDGTLAAATDDGLYTVRPGDW